MTDEKYHTQVPNLILENAARLKVSPIQFNLILAVWRKTYGFHQKESEMTISYLSEILGGVDASNIRRDLKALEAKKIIIQRVVHGVTRYLSLNEKVQEWDGLREGYITPSSSKQEEPREGQITPSERAELPPQERAKQPPNKEINKKTLKENISAPFQEIIEYLNNKAKSSYQHTTKQTQKYIQCWWDRGFTLEDFKRVIDNKVHDWGKDPSMVHNLRPSVLFGKKFEEYLGQPSLKTGWDLISELKEKYDEKDKVDIKQQALELWKEIYGEKPGFDSEWKICGENLDVFRSWMK